MKSKYSGRAWIPSTSASRPPPCLQPSRAEPAISTASRCRCSACSTTRYQRASCTTHTPGGVPAGAVTTSGAISAIKASYRAAADASCSALRAPIRASECSTRTLFDTGTWHRAAVANGIDCAEPRSVHPHRLVRCVGKGNHRRGARYA